MKKFDLEKALAGEPVVLRNGSKAFIAKSIPTEHVKKEGELIGYLVEGSKFHSCATWTKDGKYNPCFSSHIYDIIGMWEEPRPTVTLTLPCPLKAIKDGQRVYFLNQGNFLSPIGSIIFNEERSGDCELFKNGGLFANKQDAQAWLDAMRDSRR